MTSSWRYVIGAGAGVVLAAGLLDGPLSLVSAAQFLTPAPVKTDMPLTVVDRTHKGDRLRASEPQGTTTVVQKRGEGTATTAEKADPRFVPVSLKECEPLASPFVDPRLGELSGRCFV